MQAQAYIYKTDKLLERLRMKQLGLDRKLDDLIPPEHKSDDVRDKARYLSKRILFLLLRDLDSDWTSPELTQGQQWIYEAILYLYSFCDPEDRTLGGILRLLRLPQGTRAILFEKDGYEGFFNRIKTDIQCPFLEDELELVFVQMLSEREYTRRIEGLEQYVMNKKPSSA